MGFLLLNPNITPKNNKKQAESWP